MTKNINQILAALVVTTFATLPSFADNSSQYPTPPASLVNAPTVVGGELTQYDSVYPQQKRFWGDDSISKSFANTSNQLKNLTVSALNQINPQVQPKVDPALMLYNTDKRAFERRAQQLTQGQSQTPDLYRWSGDKR